MTKQDDPQHDEAPLKNMQNRSNYVKASISSPPNIVDELAGRGIQDIHLFVYLETQLPCGFLGQYCKPDTRGANYSLNENVTVAFGR